MTASKIKHPRFVLFLAVLVCACAALAWFMPPDIAIALGFDTAAMIFLSSAAPLWRRSTPNAMRSSAARDDGGRVLLLGVSVIILAAVLIVLGTVVERRSTVGIEDLALVIATLVLAWSFSNLLYAFHYAHLFYDQDGDANDQGGLAFPGGGPPDFSDFCYFAFVLGMTFQVSDVEITSSALRKVATLHGILAFFFNLGVLALTINVLAGAL